MEICLYPNAPTHSLPTSSFGPLHADPLSIATVENIISKILLFHSSDLEVFYLSIDVYPSSRICNIDTQWRTVYTNGCGAQHGETFNTSLSVIPQRGKSRLMPFSPALVSLHSHSTTIFSPIFQPISLDSTISQLATSTMWN